MDENYSVTCGGVAVERIYSVLNTSIPDRLVKGVGHIFTGV